MQHYLAFDLGAESGRAMLGTLSDSGLAIEELHRFPNTPVRVLDGLYWDTLRLWHEIRHGLGVAARERRLTLNGVGIDTWGVDFALLGRDGALVDNPRHYRDARTNGIMEKMAEAMPRADIFAQTGIQFIQLNTLCQLYAMKLAGSPALDAARTLLFMPDLFNYWMTGVARAELTIASTSQFYNPCAKGWATGVLERLGLPTGMLPEIVQPGTPLGPLLDSVWPGTGAPPTVYTTACHDTASAVAAVPAQGDDWCYISSGTWSLMGAELAEPIVNQTAMSLNLTNEVGAGGRIRLLKNIAGLWLVQECRRAWSLEGTGYNYDELARLAAAAAPFTAIISPDAFLEPGDMPEKIAAYCVATGQNPPQTHGEFSRTILESLALRYRQVLESLETLIGRRFRVIHIVGGGSRNAVLNQFVADATGRTVAAGPGEATAIGNVLIQAMGSGALASLEEARAVVRRSWKVEIFEPKPAADWDAAYRKYLKIVG
ncbi:MAG TPA: FGGY-family carbohydrate kinase [Bryobacteraceae bacterium]|nr:FGGY-family carbohydrate kinase [Bryobacteraceae bacterium]